MKDISKYLEIRRVMSMYFSMRRLDLHIYVYLKGTAHSKGENLYFLIPDQRNCNQSYCYKKQRLGLICKSPLIQ